MNLDEIKQLFLISSLFKNIILCEWIAHSISVDK